MSRIPSFQRDRRFGATVLSGGDVHFRLWAPGQKYVFLDFPDREAHTMQRNDQGMHECVVACEPGARYRYRYSDGRSFPDPASRRQDGDVDGLSCVVDPAAYRWRNSQWRGLAWEQTVIYEVHAGLAGGFAGVRAMLPDLLELGINTVELMPVAEFSGARNWGYDGVLPFAPESAYGSPDDLRALVDAAHGLGMQVLLDVVYNHFGPEGNYLFDCVPEFFRTDVSTPWGHAIDFRQPAVRDFFTANALHWLQEYRLDGLRLDAVHAILEKDWLLEMAASVRAALGTDRRVHLIVENDDNDAELLRNGFDAQWNDDIHHVIHHMLTEEDDGYYAAYTSDPEHMLARALSEGFVYQGEPCLTRDGRPRGQPSADLPPNAFVFFLQNHDQVGNRAFGERLNVLSGQRPDALKAARALQLLSPQVPLIFMGEERGATTPFLYFTDFRDSALVKAIRDGRQREFGHFNAYVKPGGRSGLPEPNAESSWEASNPFAEPPDHETRAVYRELLHIRREFISHAAADARSEGAEPLGRQAVVARWRLDHGARLSLYCNLSDTDCRLADGVLDAGERCIYSSRHLSDSALHAGTLPAATTVATLLVPEQRRQHDSLYKDAPWQ